MSQNDDRGCTRYGFAMRGDHSRGLQGRELRASGVRQIDRGGGSTQAAMRLLLRTPDVLRAEKILGKRSAPSPHAVIGTSLPLKHWMAVTRTHSGVG